MRVYFVRHGESEFSAQKLQQHAEVPLSALGKRQAEFLAERFRGVPFDIVISSPYRRAKETAEVINRVAQRPAEYWDVLRELKRPSEIEGRRTEDPDVVELKQRIVDNFEKGNWRHSDEETYNELRARANKAICLLEARLEEHILAVSHEMFIQMLMACILFGPSLTAREFLPLYYGLTSSNTGVTVCDFKEGKWRLITWNDRTHLDRLE